MFGPLIHAEPVFFPGKEPFLRSHGVKKSLDPEIDAFEIASQPFAQGNFSQTEKSMRKEKQPVIEP